MINDQIVEYVRSQVQAGVSKESIRTSLISSGWTEQDINETFNRIGTPAPSGLVAVPPAKRNPVIAWSVGILVVILIIAPVLYSAYKAYQAHQALQRELAVIRQQLQQDQQAMNGDTSLLGTTTPPTSAIAEVHTGATVTSTGTQTVAQDTAGPYGDARGTVTITGTASVGSVEVILKPVSYTAGFITGSPTMYTSTSTDYASNANTGNVEGPLSVSGGTWSTKVPDTAAGDYTVLIYDSEYTLIGTGTLTVQIGKKWGAPSATIDQSSLTATSHNPIITGSAANVADLNVQVGEDYYDPHVENGTWATYSPTTLAAGTYTVTVRTLATREDEKVLATGTLIVK